MNQVSTDGALRLANSLNSFNWPGEREGAVTRAWGVLALFATGVAATVLHQSFRWPLQLPGHHGIEWLALLVLARLVSPRERAGLLTGVGAAGAAFAYAGSIGIDGKSAQMLTYMLQGALLDALLFLPRVRWTALLWIPTAGALTHVVAPLVKNLFTSLSGELITFSALMHGIGYPMITHAIFGATGAAIGLGLYYGTQMRRGTQA